MTGMPEWLSKPEAMRAVDRYFSGENVDNYRGALRRLLANPDLLDVAENQRGVKLGDADAEIAHFKKDWVGSARSAPAYWRKADPALIQDKIRATFIGALAKALDDHAAGGRLRPIRLLWICAEMPTRRGDGGIFDVGLTVDEHSITVVFSTSAPPDQPAAGDSGVVATDGLELRGNPGTLGASGPRVDPSTGTVPVLRVTEVDGRMAAVDGAGAVLWTIDERGTLDDCGRHGE